MSHEVEKMMFTGKKPWWYGNSAQQGAVGIDLGANAVTSEVAMKEAGLDWTATKHRAGFRDPGCLDLDGNPVWREANTDCFLIRSSDQAVLGRCTDAYEEFQNAQAFEFLDGLVSEGNLLYHTAGSLEGGKRVWILAQTPTTWTVKRKSGKENTHHAFLLAMLGHDCKYGINLLATDVRAECANTVGWADQRAEAENMVFRVQHRGDIKSKLTLAATAIEAMESQSAERRETLQAMAQLAMNTDEFIDFATSIFLGLDGEPEQVEEGIRKFYSEATSRQKTIMENKAAGTALLFQAGQGNEGDSGYDALQALTEYFDHFDLSAIQDKVKLGKRAARVVKDSWLGAGAERKALAYKRLEGMVAR